MLKRMRSMTLTLLAVFKSIPDARAPSRPNSHLNIQVLAPRHPDTFENSKYDTRGLSFSVTEPSTRVPKKTLYDTPNR